MSAPRYESLANELLLLIANGVLRAGDRLPSVRATCRSHTLSPATVLQAYYLLERRGLVEARPKSGYYVRPRPARHLPEPRQTRPTSESTQVDISDFVFDVLYASRDQSVVPLGSGFPSPELFPLDKLARHLGAAARHMDAWATVRDLPPGNDALRRQIALRYLAAGAPVSPQEIVITNGAMEALNLCLQAVAQPGDLVAVESPTFYASLQAIERLQLKAVEIPTHPREGVSLTALAKVLEQQPVKACLLMLNFQNPLGSRVPEDKRRELLALLARHDVPLIEDDVYAELHFDGELLSSKTLDGAGRVLHCGSFAKCLAPGYRVGWVAAGRYTRSVERLKFMTSLASNIPTQIALADYLQQGGFEPHLRRLRRALAQQQAQLMEAVARHFPAETRVSRPEGGYFLWLELPEGTDTLVLHRRALAQGISIAPGPIFSAKREYRNCLRLNFGHPWDERLDTAVAALGRLVADAA
ncbi:putative transcriptional regulator [Oryzomicrobium terrae]|uniref:Putative transcriptional regulator n=1 Tax=Oryzomicrobium terrae TaxID=1735038 RepID=A0A5C1E5M0_9RHOO|nr:PLP-dependent aminotransferase family protein [Oryzomicrobium terrae]QEL64222.1 putative transcriptional regulator [Oryzomicrobium terrae]